MTRPRKWLAGCGGLLLAVALAVAALTYALADPNPLGHFRSAGGEQQYKDAYRAAMRSVPEPSRTVDIETSYGSVRVYEFSNAADRGEPVVLLAGRSSGVPMWATNLKDLAAAKTVYALDALGDAGFSVQRRPIAGGADQARWLEEALDGLHLAKLHLVGHSFGGWLAANYAVRSAQRVRTLTLLEPVFVFEGLRWQIYAVTIPAALPFLPRSWRDGILEEIGGGPVDRAAPIARMISAAAEHFASNLPLPERMSDTDLRKLAMPVYTALGARSSMLDAGEAQQAAQENVRNLRIRIWPDATHSLPMEVAPQLDRELLRFFTENEVGR